MKLLATTALTLCLILLVGCADDNAPSTETSATIANANNKVEANITGMTCSGCSGEVVAAVEDIDGVKAASADFETGDVKVALEDTADTDAKLKEIKSVLAGLSDGKYKVKTITATPPADSEPSPTQQPDNQKSAADEQAGSEATQASAYTSYNVTGMHCDACSSQITEAVKVVKGVKQVNADYKTGKVEVAFEDQVDDKVKTGEVKSVIAGLSSGRYTVNQ